MSQEVFRIVPSPGDLFDTFYLPKNVTRKLDTQFFRKNSFCEKQIDDWIPTIFHKQSDIFQKNL